MYNKLDSISIEEYISEGIILIDKNGTIIKYNSKAKEILGLSGYYETSHKQGTLQSGDILIFVDTSVGDDDGRLTSEILNSYGVKCNSGIKEHGLLYIGQKDAPNFAKYKIIEPNSISKHELRSELQGHKLYCACDYDKKIASINVDDRTFELSFFLNIANTVIIRNKDLIFYQMKGYTARKESLLDIMNGVPFKAKEGIFNLDVEGTNIYHFHSENTLTQNLVSVASGRGNSYIKNKLSNINGFTVMSTIHPIDIGGIRCGALLTMTDVSTLEKSQAELSAALNELENLRRAYQIKDMFPEIIGNSVPMKEVKRLAAKAASSDTNILILGESGTGKSFIAKKIHKKSERKEKSFLEINCCAIPRELMESELFGYEKGAFTGARLEGKKGIFEIADGGTVFMDEIGDMPLEMQAKLLLFIENRKFFRVGGSIEISVNVRIITATNKNLEEEIRGGRFREDLYYRLNILPIFIEPLRNRREDIGLMIEYIMENKNKKFGERKVLSTKANKRLLGHGYPGNVREMENILERAFVLSEGNVIYPEHLMIQEKNLDSHINISDKSLNQAMSLHEKEIIMKALRINDNNHQMTYKYLGIGKTCFYEKLKKYGL